MSPSLEKKGSGNPFVRKVSEEEERNKKRKQAGAELCQAQEKL